MRKLFIGTIVALAASPAAALANSSPAHKGQGKSPAQACRQERKADPQAFAHKYGTNKNGRNAFGKCVSQKAHANQTASQPAAQPSAGDNGTDDNGQGDDHGQCHGNSRHDQGQEGQKESGQDS